MSRTPSSLRMGPLRWAVVLAAAWAAAGCTHHPAPGQRIDDVCRMENKGQRVVASGYFQAPILIGCETKNCTFQLTSSRKEKYGLSIRIPLGSGPGSMTPLPPSKGASPAVPFQVERVDPQVRDATGSRVSAGDVVKVEGTLEAYEDSGKVRCTVDVTRFESL